MRSSSELPQEADIALEHGAKIRDLIQEHRDALDSHAEGEAGQIPRAAAVAGHFEKPAMDHAGAQDLEPARAFADFAAARALALAEKAAHIDLSARLDEGEIAGTKPDLGFRAEDFASEEREHA